MPHFDRRRLLAAAAVTLGALGVASPWPVFAQSSTSLATSSMAYPNRPVTLVSVFSPGSPQDLVVRAVAEIVAADLKQPVIVDNKPGANGGIAQGYTATQKPDGYTLCAANSTGLAILPLMQKLAYDATSDLTYIMQMVSFPIGVVVKADNPFKSWADLVAHAMANPGKITYGTTGPGSTANLGMQRLQGLAGISLTHVPHKGSMEIIPAVLGDHIMLMVTGTEWKPQVDAGNMRLLMMWTDKRLAAFANVPTARESGYPFDLDATFGLIAPKGLEAGVQARVHGAFKTALETASVRALIEKYDMVPSYADGAAFKARMASISADLKPVIDQLGLARKE